MSRHSKNNTAHSIFTQGEKQMLDGQGWGTVKQRLGKESFKDFSSCSICLKRVELPVSCLEGHLFCKECILNQISCQQKIYKEKLSLWERQSKQIEYDQQRKLSDLNSQKAALFQKLENSEIGQKEFEKFDEDRKYKFMSEDKRLQTKARDFLQSKDKKLLSRKEMIQNNYWIPETTPGETVKLVEKPRKVLVCPEEGHRIKRKKLVDVLATMDKATGVFLCGSCSNSIIHHSSYLLRCGHLFCSECIKHESSQCLICLKQYTKKDVIKMARSGTMFSAHNKVEAKIFNPVFQC